MFVISYVGNWHVYILVFPLPVHMTIFKGSALVCLFKAKLCCTCNFFRLGKLFVFFFLFSAPSHNKVAHVSWKEYRLCYVVFWVVLFIFGLYPVVMHPYISFHKHQYQWGSCLSQFFGAQLSWFTHFLRAIVHITSFMSNNSKNLHHFYLLLLASNY